MQQLRNDAQQIIEYSIQENLPGAAVRHALANHSFTGNIYLVAVGKAGWTMAQAAHQQLGSRIQKGVVITKYGHSMGEIPGLSIIEAGHPLSDNNTLLGTQQAIDLASSLTEKDELLFLISGGGSALFERPLAGVSLEDIVDINQQLLSSGADIVEINMIRKRLSGVKGGRFAQIAAPAKVFTVVLSDVLGDRLDSIASGPCAPDMSTAEDAQRVVSKYKLQLSPLIAGLLQQETPKQVTNVETVITGSVTTLCNAAAQKAQQLGYTPYVLCSGLNCEAADAGRMLASMAAQVNNGAFALQAPCALIAGGETVVHLKGKGRGGRNQELALAAAEGIAGLDNVLVFSLGSDGTDGPTDAAGGIVDGGTLQALAQAGVNYQNELADNNAYYALGKVNGLIITGPTGTNVNDVSVVLVR